MASSTPLAETVALGHDGELRLPDALLHRLGWQEGDRVILSVDDHGAVRALSIREAVAGLRGILKPHGDGNVADELIEERRREAEHE